MPSSAIYGCSGLRLTPQETKFFKDNNPAGFILFARNIESSIQVIALVDEVRSAVSRDLAVLIDQEGGRVRRLKPPHWREAPSMGIFGQIFEKDRQAAIVALELNSQILGLDLGELGINVNCLPVLDIPQQGADPIISDRAFSTDIDLIIDMGRIVIECLESVGCLPVIKHIPGHGRALVDSHKALPIVNATHETLSENDFRPFKALSSAPFAMTAHIIYEDIDKDNVATFSDKIVRDVIRGEIGFQGLLVSDDLGMNALAGNFGERAQKTFKAGVDLALHCSGDMEEMAEVAANTPELSYEKASQFVGFLEKTKVSLDIDARELEAHYNKIVEKYL